MTHRRLIIQERITAIIGAVLLTSLVGLSYYYSVAISVGDLKYLPSPTSPDFVADNVTLTDFDKTGVAKQRLFARTVEHFSDDRMSATGTLVYTLEPGEPQIVVRADRADSPDGLETIDLSGNVRVTREADAQNPKLTFRSDFLKGWLDTYQFETDRPVYMSRGQDTTTSEHGMHYDNIEHRVTLFGRVQSVFQPSSAIQAKTAKP